MAIPLTDFENF